MPIEFTCTGCGRMLRTPDESAGKKAKCPECSTIVDVPAGSVPPEEPTVPEASQSEAPESHVFSPSPFSDASDGDTPFSDPFAGDSPYKDSVASPKGPASSDPANPYASPSLDSVKPDIYAGPHGSAASSATRTGFVWENERKTLKTFWATAKLIIGSPTKAFQQMRRDGGLGDPILFGMAGGLMGNLVTAAYNSLLQGGMFALVGFAGPGNGEELGMMAVMIGIQIVWQFVWAIIMGTLFVLVGMFVNAGITHLFLMLFKGANQSFETTFRVGGYVTGATSLFLFIPFMGWLAQLITSLIFLILGLTAAHETTGGKAAGAVLTPLAICCALFVVPMIGLFVWAINEGGF